MVEAAVMPLRCVRWAISRPVVWGISTGLGIILGFVLGSVIYRYVEATAPEIPHLVGDVNVWRGSAGTIWLSAHYESSAPFHCLRQDSQLLVDYSKKSPTYYSLGAGMGGRGLIGSIYSYDILRSLPADFPPGDWTFVFRLHYECEPVSIVHWERTLEPVTVHIPEVP